MNLSVMHIVLLDCFELYAHIGKPYGENRETFQTKYQLYIYIHDLISKLTRRESRDPSEHSFYNRQFLQSKRITNISIVPLMRKTLYEIKKKSRELS